MSIIESEAIQENEVEPLPEELFDDLADEDSQVKGQLVILRCSLPAYTLKTEIIPA